MIEDISNYGRGGYYGNTYNQEQYRRERETDNGTTSGLRDNYRHLGDKRWSDKRETLWEAELPARTGYRGTQERIRLGNDNNGKGPRFYRRSDARILEDLNERLYDDPYVNASDIETRVQEGEVILAGTVEDRHSKRRAEDIADGVSGVRNVENRLRIRSRDTAPGNEPRSFYKDPIFRR